MSPMPTARLFPSSARPPIPSRTLFFSSRRASTACRAVTPTGLALTPDESRLYVSLGDSNAVSVVDLAAMQCVLGYIPTGWYPTAVVASPLKKQILVANAKGTQTRYPNPATSSSASPDSMIST